MMIQLVHLLPVSSPGQCALPGCQESALAHCGLLIPSLAGPLRAFFCLFDYLQVLGLLQAGEEQQAGDGTRAARALEILRERVLQVTQDASGPLPPRSQLWKELSAADQACQQARIRYHACTDDGPQGRAARLDVLWRAARCLFCAICLEARAQQDGSGDRAVAGTLYSVSQPFLTDDLRVIEAKAITRVQVATALLALCAARAEGRPDEALERASCAGLLTAAFDLSDRTGAGLPSHLTTQYPELAQALTQLSSMGSEEDRFSPGGADTAMSGKIDRRAGTREGRHLEAGLGRLLEGLPPTASQARAVGSYVQALQMRIESLIRLSREHEIEEETWRRRYSRLASEWNEVCAALAQIGVRVFFREDWEWEGKSSAGPGAGSGYSGAGEALLAALHRVPTSSPARRRENLARQTEIAGWEILDAPAPQFQQVAVPPLGPDEPCIQVEYDADFYGEGIHSADGDFAYIPQKLVLALGIEVAFEMVTGLTAVHILHWDESGDPLYTSDGDFYSEDLEPPPASTTHEGV